MRERCVAGWWSGVVALSLACGGPEAETPSMTTTGGGSIGDDQGTTPPVDTGGSTLDPSGDAGTSTTSAVDTGTGDTTSDTEGPVGCGVPAGVNAMIDAQGVLRPLVPVTGGAVEALAFERDGDQLHALTPEGDVHWTSTVGPGALSGGFDFDADGWPDLVIAHHEEGPMPCGRQTVGTSWLSLWRGSDGQMAAQTSTEADICWTFGAVTYPTVQWTTGTLLFGPHTATMLASPTYASTSNFLAWDGVDLTATPLHYPSTASYDSTYTADLPNAWGTGTSYLANSHIANGMMVEVGGESRVVLFTSGRAVQYADAMLDADQLRADRPYLTGGRTDIAGRNYGLVSVDPALPGQIALMSGTTAYSVYADMVAGAMSFDPWGQIERHVSRYDLAANTVIDRFYSYAHDAGDGHQYEGRVAYPDSPWVRVGSGQASRLAYSVYEAGHWILHVSTPGGVDDALALQGHVLWDVRDLDGDGVDEWVTSPSELPGDPDVPGYYFTYWRTDLWHWDEDTLTLLPVAVHEGGLPALVGAFPQATRRSSMGALYPAPVVADERCEPALVLRGADGVLERVGIEG